MADDINFIDKLVKESVKDYKELSNTSWKDMEMYLENKEVIFKSFQTLNSLKNVKINFIILTGTIVLSVGIWYFYNLSDSQSIPINQKESIVKKTDLSSGHRNNYFIKQQEIKKDRDSSSKKSFENTKIDENKTVRIKVEVPVYKKIVVRKKIIIKDTINKN